MSSADVSWYIKEPDDTYIACTEYFAGSCNSKEDFILYLDLWNNRWNNKEDVDDMVDAKLVISFLNAEDSILLSLCTVQIEDNDFVKVETMDLNKGVVNIGTISGQKNNGNENNIYNHKKIIIKFSNIPNNLRDGLKSMFLDVQFD